MKRRFSAVVFMGIVVVSLLVSSARGEGTAEPASTPLSRNQSQYLQKKHPGNIKILGEVEELLSQNQVWEAGQKLWQLLENLGPYMKTDVCELPQFETLARQYAEMSRLLAGAVEASEPLFREAVNETGQLLARHRYKEARIRWKRFFDLAADAVQAAEVPQLHLAEDVDLAGASPVVWKRNDRREELPRFFAIAYHFWNTHLNVDKGWQNSRTFQRLANQPPKRTVRTQGLEYSVQRVTSGPYMDTEVRNVLRDRDLLQNDADSGYIYLKFSVKNRTRKDLWVQLDQVRVSDIHGLVYFEPLKVTSALDESGLRTADPYLNIPKRKTAIAYRVIEVPHQLEGQGFLIHFPDAKPSDLCVSTGPYYSAEGADPSAYLFGDDPPPEVDLYNQLQSLEASTVTIDKTDPTRGFSHAEVAEVNELDSTASVQTGEKLYNAGRYDEAIPLLETACKTDAQSCFYLGHIWALRHQWGQAELDDDTLQDILAKATYVLGMACEAGNPHACLMFGGYFRDGHSTHIDVAEIRQGYLRQTDKNDKYKSLCVKAIECAEGIVGHCTQVGEVVDTVAVDDGRVKGRHAELKRHYLEKACDAGDALACHGGR